MQDSMNKVNVFLSQCVIWKHVSNYNHWVFIAIFVFLNSVVFVLSDVYLDYTQKDLMCR